MSAEERSAAGGAEASASTPGADLHIREAQPGDLKTILAFNVAMAKETEDLELPLEVVRAGTARVVDGKAAARYYVVADAASGELLGQLMITFEWSDW